MTQAENTPDDKMLVANLQSKESDKRAAAFSILIKRYSERLYWHIRHLVLTHEDTDDLLQNTFIKAWSNIDKFRGESQLSTWLYRIATNETLTFISRKQLNTVSIDTPEGSIAELLESDANFNGDRADAILHEAISHLPEKQRIVFCMRYFEEMQYETIAQITDTSVGALKASYHIAVKKIEEYIDNAD